MSTSMAAERRMLSAAEFGLVARSHYPAICEATRPDLVALARQLREHRNKARDLIRQQRRARSGKAEPRGTRAAPSEAGMSRRKQVFAAAVRRLNGRIELLGAEEKRSRQTQLMRDALERKRRAPVHHPQPGRTASGGMRRIESDQDAVRVDPREVGRVSQFVRDAQARRDSAGARHDG